MDIDRERLFRNFDWAGSSAWQSYIRNVYPVPSAAQVHRIKRKWYQRNVDTGFRVEHEAPPRQPSPPLPQRNYNARTVDALALLQVSLFVLAPFMGNYLHFLTAGYFAALLRKHGRLSLQNEYWSRAIRDEEVQSMAYCFLFVAFGDPLFAILPASIGTVATCAELVRNRSQVPLFFSDLCAKVQIHSTALLRWKARLELLLGPTLLITALIAHTPVALALLYSQFLVGKVWYSVCMQETVQELRVYWECVRDACRKARAMYPTS